MPVAVELELAKELVSWMAGAMDEDLPWLDRLESMG